MLSTPRNAIVEFDGQQQTMDDLASDLARQIALLPKQQDQLLNLQLLEEIDQSKIASKSTALRDRIAQLTPQMETCDRSDRSDIAVNVVDFSQSLRKK